MHLKQNDLDVETSLTMAKAALQSSPVGAAIVASAGARVLFANRAAEKMLGYREAELEGKTLEQLLPSSAGGQFRALMDGVRAGSSTQSAETGDAFQLRHREGHDVSVAISLAPLAASGEPCVIVYISHLAEQRQGLRQLEQIIDAMPQGVLLVDASGMIVMTNPALDEQFGYASDELVGKPLDMLLPERYRGGHKSFFRAYGANPSQRKMGTGRDLTGLHKTGVEFPVEIALNTVDFGTARQLMAVISDISVRKNAEHALRDTNAQLEEFTYVASHDLRSPLHGIADLLNWIKEDLPAEAMTPAIAHNFDRAEIRIARCERMIEDLLEYARAGQGDSSTELTDLSAIVTEIVGDLAIPAAFAVERNIDVPPFRAAKTPLSHCMRNLIANAVKHHGGEGGKILIRAKVEGRFAVISVEDDGPGVPDGAETRIFKLFHRATSTTEGHGVGLAVTRRMVNAQGGTIVVERSQTLGGACFRIHWPSILMKEVRNE